MTVKDGMVVTDDMSFELAFNETAAPKEEPKAEIPTEEPKEEPKADVPTEEPKEEPKAEPPVEEPKEEPKPEPPKEDPRLAALEAELAALKAAAQPKEEPKQEAPVLSQEDEEFLNGFREEWPDAQKALLLQRKQLEAEFDKKLQAALAKVQEQMAPFAKVVQETEQDRFVREVTAQHPDAQMILPSVEKWVGALPPALRKAYTAILETGTSGEVSELFSYYKQLHPTAPAAPAATKEKDKAREARLDKMAGVRSERTGITAEPDPNDFEGAFAQAARGR